VGTELLPSYWRKEITRKLKAFLFHFTGLHLMSGLIIDGASIDLLLMVAGCPARLISKRDLFGRVFLVEGAANF
jgi:hypothetical protein